METKLDPTKTYATPENATKAALKWIDGDGGVRFMVVGVPGTNRYTPLFYGSVAISMAGQIAFNGWPVVG